MREAVDPMILIQQAADIAGVHRETLKNEARRGRLKLFRISQRKIGVRQSELERYLSATAY
jgi:predicted site-specific integrase-resolvase